MHYVSQFTLVNTITFSETVIYSENVYFKGIPIYMKSSRVLELYEFPLFEEKNALMARVTICAHHC